MPVTISVGETRYIGLTSGAADEPPIWGVVFQLNRDDDIATAIGITVRCDTEADARDQALSKLQGFLSEASAAGAALVASTRGCGRCGEPAARSQEIDEDEAREEAVGEQPEGVAADEIDQGDGHRTND
jgi:hypothetical protein